MLNITTNHAITCTNNTLCVSVLSMKVLIKDAVFTSLTGDRTPILRGHPSNTKL